MYYLFKIIVSFFLILNFTSCSQVEQENQVIVYVSVDQVYSSKLLKQFEKETNIKVRAVYDTEASKAVGLARRLLAEKNSPHADLFWNSEFLRTESLVKEGVLLNLNLDDAEYTKKMGLRSRVLIVNTDLVKKENYPSTLKDLTRSRYKGKVAICSPYYGTASTHFSALYVKFGKEKFLHFIKELKNNDVTLLAGNSVVKDAVGHGKYLIGLVDTDDALVGIKQGLPIKMIYYDQDKTGMFSIHQTLSIIKGAPHPENAKKLLSYLATSGIEKQLIKMNAVQFPLLSKKKALDEPRLWTLSGKKLTKALKPSIKLMRSYLE